MLKRRLLLGVSIALAAAPPTLIGQVPDAIAYSECTIRAEQVLRIGANQGPGEIPGRPSAVLRDGRGRYWILTNAAPPMVYGADGRFIKTVGQIGKGPGEFRGPGTGLALPGDSVLILDWLAQRATVVAPNLTFARSIRLPGRVFSWGTALIRWPDRIVVSAALYSSETAGGPLHMLSMRKNAAEILRSFGLNDRELRMSDLLHLGVKLTAPFKEKLWTVNESEYLAIEWDRDGNRLRSFRRQPSWFAGKSNLRPGGHTKPPSPGTEAVLSDSSGLVWVFTRVPARNWRAAWANVPRLPAGVTGEFPASRGVDLLLLFDTNLEAIDPVTRRVLSRTQVSGTKIIGPIGHGLVAEYREDLTGAPYVSIMRYRLSRRGS